MSKASTRTLFYIPGLGNKKTDDIQERYLRLWGRIHHREIYFFRPNWHSSESYNEKWKRLEESIASIRKESLTVVGVSAGASLAVRLSSENPRIPHTITVCGKLKGFDSIGKEYLKRAPALYESVKYSENSITKLQHESSRFTCYSSLFDPVVPNQDTYFSRARRKNIPIVGHSIAIVLYLVFFLPRK